MSTTSSSTTKKEALALENNLIKQKKPRYNILLRDDKTYPYIKLTTRRALSRASTSRAGCAKTASLYFGPYFPANLAYRIVDLIHRHFLIPSCKLDLNRYSSAAVLAVLHRALSRPMRRGPHHARALRRSRSRRAASSSKARQPIWHGRLRSA